MNWHARLLVGGSFLALLAPSQEASPSLTASPQASATRFVTIGHFRDLVTDFPELLFEVADAINAENPDYVFLLGDFIWKGRPAEWETFDRFLKALNAPVFSSPGNHEFYSTPGYRARFGYLYNTLITDDANFVFINSSDSVSVIKNYLEPKWNQLDNGRPTVLLSHFILWTPILDHGKLWDKSFEPEEILPYLSGKVDYIISGDNTHNVGGSHEPDTFDQMVMYPVGIGFAGDGGPVVFFVGEVEPTGGLTMTPRYIELDPDDRWYNVDRADLSIHRAERASELRHRLFWRLTDPIARSTAVYVSLFWMGVILFLVWRRRHRSR